MRRLALLLYLTTSVIIYINVWHLIFYLYFIVLIPNINNNRLHLLHSVLYSTHHYLVIYSVVAIRHTLAHGSFLLMLYTYVILMCIIAGTGSWSNQDL